MENTETLSLHYELLSYCVCSKCDDEGNEMLDKSGEPIPSETCYGCFDDELANIKHDLLNQWLDANGYELDTKIKIVGSRMTWRGVGGYKYTTPKTLVEDLMLNGDFTLRFYASNDYKTLKVVRSSHDELGASFEFELVDPDEYDPEYY